LLEARPEIRRLSVIGMWNAWIVSIQYMRQQFAYLTCFSALRRLNCPLDNFIDSLAIREYNARIATTAEAETMTLEWPVSNMSEQAITHELAAVLSPSAGKSRSSADAELLANRFADGWTTIGPAIALAGAAYAIVLATGSTIVYITSTLLGIANFALNEIGQGVAMVFVYGFFAALTGLILASIVALAILPMVYLFTRSLAVKGSIVRLAAFSGGLVGFVAVLPFFLLIMYEGIQTWWQTAITVLVGPALTTVFGQIGGAWSGWRVGWYEQAVARAAVGGDVNPAANSAIPPSDGDLATSTRFQFGIWHLLVISIWVSLLLTAIRISGFEFLFAILLLVGWAGYQLVTLWVGGILAGRIGQWRVQRKGRST
jgi:hypothetical protein